MSVFTMVTAIVVACCAVPVAIVWLVQRGKMERALLAKAQADGAMALQIKALEDRVRVLEAVVTDPAHALRHEFRSLTDAA